MDPKSIKFIPFVKGKSAYATYIYKHPETWRTFEVRQLRWRPLPFWMCEWVPNGQVIEFYNYEFATAWYTPKIRILESRYGPNGLIAACFCEGIPADKLMLCGEGFTEHSRYFANLDEVKMAIVSAIDQNVRYKASLQDELGQSIA